MRWKQGRRSSNVEDRRGQRVAVPGGAKVGGGALLLALVAALILGENPLKLIGMFTGGGEPTVQETGPPPGDRPDDEAADFTSVVLASTEDVWNDIFANAGYEYREPSLVLYDDAVQSACGFNSAATGPFYCPGDQQVYLDLSFLRELQRLGAGGDFAFAYVIAHEVGHHVQTITGLEPEVRRRMAQSPSQRNQLSVRMELQADCYAGVWAHHANRTTIRIEEGDIEDGLRAAAAIGDDRLQRQAGRRVQPESFTHGSSEQRVRWFRTGFQSGDEDACDTFSG